MDGLAPALTDSSRGSGLGQDRLERRHGALPLHRGLQWLFNSHEAVRQEGGNPAAHKVINFMGGPPFATVDDRGGIGGLPSLAGRHPSSDGLAQSFQQSFEFGLAMLHPPHAVPQLLDVVSQPCL